MFLFDAKPTNIVFYLLEWTHTPNPISLIPENRAYDATKQKYENIVTGKAVNHNRQV